MTRDNSGKVDTRTGDPGKDLEPADVIKCRECHNMVRRVNEGHLKSDRCRYVKPEDVRTNRQDRDDLLRQDHPETVQEYKEKYPDAPVMSPRERMQLAEANSDEEVDQRRKELVTRRWFGENMSDIVEHLAEKHDVSENAIWRDWSDRERWMGRVFGVADLEMLQKEGMAQKRLIAQRLLKTARLARDQGEFSDNIRALKEANRVIEGQIDIAQDALESMSDDEVMSLGQTDVSEELIAEQDEGPGADLSSETLEHLDELTGGEGEEVIDAAYTVKEEADD